MKKNIDFLLQQRGGMLVELMMSLAIAAIMIPFLFRYQQNTVERARNIAVNKQMEAVQSALEKHIVQNRASYMRQSGNHTWADVHLCNLIDAKFLPDDFSNDCTNCYSGCTARKSDVTDFGTYSLRVLKTQGAGGHDVLQGVVLLSNDDTPLRTREIVNLGGGKIGYIDGTNVRGGFNVFVRPKTDMGLNNATAGLVGSTRTLRGNNEYLWRVPSDNESDATMQSPLNLDGHDIVNIKDASVSRAVFNTELDAKYVGTQNILYLLNRPTFNLSSENFVFQCGDATINGFLYTANNSLNVEDILHINGRDYTGGKILNVNGGLYTKEMSGLQDLTIGSSSKPMEFNFGGNFATLKMEVEAGRNLHIRSENEDTDKIAGITPRLSITKAIEPAPGSSNNKHYWRAQEHKIFLPNVALTNLRSGLARVYGKLHVMAASEPAPVNDTLIAPSPTSLNGDSRFKLYSDWFLFGKGGSNDNFKKYKVKESTPFIDVLGINLCRIRTVIEIKFNCLETGRWSKAICQHVLNNDYPDSVFSHCKPGDGGLFSGLDTVPPFTPNPDNPWSTPDDPDFPDPWVVPVDPGNVNVVPDNPVIEQNPDPDPDPDPWITPSNPVDDEEQKKQEEEQKKQEELEKQNQQGDDVIHIRSL